MPTLEAVFIAPPRILLPFLWLLNRATRPSIAGAFAVAAMVLLAPHAGHAAAKATTTTLAVTSAGSPVTTVAHPTLITLTATVEVTSTSAKVLAGTVLFCDLSAGTCADVHLVNSAQLIGTGVAAKKGTASYVFTPGIGSHSYTAYFVGTTADLSSVSAASPLAVTGMLTSTTTIAQSGSAGNYTLTGTVTGNGTGTVGPTGDVSFLDTTNSNFELDSQALGAPVFGLGYTAIAGQSLSNIGAIAVADLNHDGIPDLVVGVSGTLYIYLGGPGQTFTQKATYPISSPAAIIAADFNNDGKLDLAVVDDSSSSSSNLYILLGNGDGTFTSSSTHFATDTAYIAAGDFNNDGNLDLAITEPDTLVNAILILKGNGDGTFTAQTPITSPAGFEPENVFTADFDGDGNVDLVVSGFSGESTMIYLGHGNFTFTNQSTTTTAPGNVSDIAIGDFNGDGIPDLAELIGTGGTTLRIWLGDGHGNLSLKTSLPAPNVPYSITAADFNGDGKADLAVNSSDGTGGIWIYLGQGDGTFDQVTPRPATPSYPNNVIAADLNGDGFPDLVYSTAYFSAMPSTGFILVEPTATATATATGISPAGTGTHNVLASFPGDTNFPASQSATTALTAEPISTSLVVTPNPASSILGQFVELTAVLSPSSGQDHNTDGQTVTFTTGGQNLGTATLSAGTATLFVSTLPVGNDSLTASYAGNTYFAAAASQPVPYTVAKVIAQVTLSSLYQVYTGSPLSATVTTNPAGLNVALTYNGSSTPPTHAGSYTVLGTVNDPSYQGSTTGNLFIAKAPATVTLSNLNQTYTGSPRSATATTNPAGLSVALKYNGSATAPTAAGTYTVVATITDSNHSGSASGTLTIAKASAIIALLGPFKDTYNGSPFAVTAATNPSGLSYQITYNGSTSAPTNAGHYAVVAVITDPNYKGFVDGVLDIDKAQATVTLGSLLQTYTGSPLHATAVTVPPGLTVLFTYNGSSTPPTNAGSYAVVGTVSDPNYYGFAKGTLVIQKATAVVTLSNLNQIWTGSPLPITATTVPPGLTVTITYNGSATAPSAVGSYPVVATVVNANYVGTKSGTEVIAKAPSTTALTAATNSPIVGNPDMLTATVTGFSSPRGKVTFTADGNLLCKVDLDATGKAHCSWTPSGVLAVHLKATYEGDINHTASSSTLNLTARYDLDPALTVSFSSTTLTYPGATNVKVCVAKNSHGTPTGAVQLLDDGSPLVSLTLGGDGCAYWYINPGLDAGHHHIRALYFGDQNNFGGYSAITDVMVNQVTTQMGVACWNSSFPHGGNYTCNVSTWSNAGSPPGDIVYTYDSGPVHHVSLSNGNASFVIADPAVGNHTVEISYPGSQNYSATPTNTQHFTVTP